MSKHQKWFKVVETGIAAGKGRMLGGRKISSSFTTQKEAEACAESWRKAGTECGVITWDE